MTRARPGQARRSQLLVAGRRARQWVLFAALGVQRCAANERWIRRDEVPRWLWRVASYVVFIMSLYPATYFVDSLCDRGAGSGAGFDALARMAGSELMAWIFVATCIAVLAYIPARVLYVLTAFRLDVDETPYCHRCSYNLTGNISGVCPECGEPIPDEQRERPAVR
jgi:hypothetical protein